MKSEDVKQELAVISSFSIRGIVDAINANNADDTRKKILKEDIVTVLKERDSFILLYYK
jgi:histone H3/H4